MGHASGQNHDSADFGWTMLHPTSHKHLWISLNPNNLVCFPLVVVTSNFGGSLITEGL